MRPNTLRTTLAPVVVGACLVLAACGDGPITDGAAHVSENTAVDKPSPEVAARTLPQEDPIIVYASLELQDDGRVKCDASTAPGPGMNFEYTLDAQNGPADDSAACVKALISADQDAVRAGQELVDEISKYLEKDHGVKTEDLEETLQELEAALIDDWDAVGEKTKDAKSSLSDVKKEVKEKKAEEEARAKKKAEQEAKKKKQNSQAKPKKSEKPAAPKVSSATSAILSATNNYRAGEGKPSLSANSCAEKWAKSHAKNMASKNSLYHQDLGPVMSNCGATGAAENIANGQPSISAAITGWWNSAGHKANMLDGKYTHMGGAVAHSASGVPYYAQVFLTK